MGALPNASLISGANEIAFRHLIATTLAIAALVAAVLIGSAGFITSLTGEGGVVETLSAAGYLVAAICLMREGSKRFVKAHFYFVVILLALCMRELDFHNMMTTMSITKTSFYVSADVPLIEKIAAIAAIATVIGAGVLMGLRHWRHFVAGVRALNPTAIAVMAAGLSIVASKTLDGLPRKLETAGIEMGANSALVSTGIEEVIELGIPLFLMCAVFAFFPRRSQTAERGAKR